MTTSFTLEHDFPGISIELFEKHLNHPDLNEKLAEMPAFRSRDLIEEKRLKNGEIHWSFKVVAGGDIPPAVQKVISKDMFSWVENTRFVPDEHCIYWSIEPLISKGKFEGKGTWLLESTKKGTRRTIEGDISVKIPLIGKIAESFIVNELKRNYEVEPKIQQTFYNKMKKSA